MELAACGMQSPGCLQCSGHRSCLTGCFPGGFPGRQAGEFPLSGPLLNSLIQAGTYTL